MHPVLRRADPLPANIHRITIAKGVGERPATDPIARLDHADIEIRRQQLGRAQA